MKHTIFCIPGFGADDQLFSKLKLSNARVQYLNWLDPLPQETLTHYAQRMAAPVHSANAILIGVSFGGMVASEIARQIPVKKVIIVSSVKTSKEMPRNIRITARLKLYKFFPLNKLRSHKLFNTIANKRLGAFTREEQLFAHSYRQKADLHYIKWSIQQIVNWQNNIVPQNLYHIHGDQDKIFPIKYIKPHYTISGGTHMMVLNKAEEISHIIEKILED